MIGEELVKLLQAYIVKHNLEESDVSFELADDEGNIKEHLRISSFGITTGVEDEYQSLDIHFYSL